jgi:hypothetical protein
MRTLPLRLILETRRVFPMSILLGCMVSVGIVAAVLLHQFAWWARLRILPVAVALGVIAAIGITGLGFLYLEPIGDVVLVALVALWVACLCLGIAQAPSIPAPWWVGVLAMFFEGVATFLVMAAVATTFQANRDHIAAAFGLGPMSPDPAFQAFLKAFFLGLIALAIGRTIWRYHQRR